MKRTTCAAVTIAVALLCACFMASCAKASAEQPTSSSASEPLEVSDVAVEPATTTVDVPAQDVDETEEQAEQAEEPAEESCYSDSEPIWDGDYYEEYYEPVYYEYEDYSAVETSCYPTDGLTPEGGVNYHDGRVETYYSSQILYHADTQEWTLDDEGFYRTDDGYYVVAASDMEQGTVFEGSKGDCIVLDCGCPDGITDYYVGW